MATPAATVTDRSNSAVPDIEALAHGVERHLQDAGVAVGVLALERGEAGSDLGQIEPRSRMSRRLHPDQAELAAATSSLIQP